MKKMICALVAVSLAGIAQGNVIANWNNNSNSLPGGGFGYLIGDFPQAADQTDQGGIAFMSLAGSIDQTTTELTAGLDNRLLWVQSFSGTTLGALAPAGSGGSLSIRNGPSGTSSNGGEIRLSFDGSLYTGITFDTAYRRSGSGASLNVGYSINGGAVQAVGQIVAGLSNFWDTYNFNFSALDGVANAEIVLTGFNGSAFSDFGNYRLDNMTISGVPTPASIALLGFGGIAAGRRRR